MTGFSYDEVSIALHDCNFDTEATINALLEGQQDQVGCICFLFQFLLASILTSYFNS